MSAAGYTRILKLGFPILVGQLGMIVVGFADTTMVGRYSTQALASASFVNSLFNVAIFLLLGFSYGLTPLVGALFGRRQEHRIGALVRTGLWVNILVALLIMAIMSAVYFNIHRLGQPPELLPVIRPYFLIYLAGLIPIAVFNVFSQWSYAIRLTSMPMWITLGANVINILGNWLLIYGNLGFPELGLTGAGLATLLARTLCPIVIVLIFMRRTKFADYARGFVHGHSEPGATGKINRTSWPLALQMAFESGSFSAAGVMAGWLGAISLAAFQVIITISTLGFCIYYSMGSAISVLIANAAGEGNRPEMRAIARRGYIIILAMAVCSSLFFIFGSRPMIAFFTPDPVVRAAAALMIIPLVIYQFGDATQITFANALRGTAHVMPMLWIAFICYVLVGLPATYIFAFPMQMGAPGIILSFSVSLFLAAGCFFYFFRRSTRLKSSKACS